MTFRMRSSRISSAAPSRAASIEAYRAAACGSEVDDPRLMVATSLNMISTIGLRKAPRCAIGYSAPAPDARQFDHMNVRPLHDRIIVQRLDEGEQKIGGIIIPDSAKEKPMQGKVLAVGDGRMTEEGTRIPLDVKAGNVILFGKYSGQEIKLDGIEYLIVKEDEVLAVIDGAEKAKKKS